MESNHHFPGCHPGAFAIGPRDRGGSGCRTRRARLMRPRRALAHPRFEWVVKESNLSSPTSLVSRQRLYRPPRGAQPGEWHRWESNPQSHEGLSFAALPVCVPCRSAPSVPDRIRTDDLLRDRQASTPDCSTRTGIQAESETPTAVRSCLPLSEVARVGLEPTAFLVLSQGGLPIAYRADCFVSARSRSRTCRTSRPRGYSPRRSPVRPSVGRFRCRPRESNPHADA